MGSLEGAKGKRKGEARSKNIPTSTKQTIKLQDVIKLDELQELLEYRTKTEQKLLTDDIDINGQKTPITLTTYEGQANCLVDGWGRVLAFEALNKNDIEYEINENLIDLDSIRAFVYRKQLGRRNLSPQAKAKIIGVMPESISKLSKILNKSSRYISDCRAYCKALEALKDEDIKDLSEMGISKVIKLHKTYAESSEVKCTNEESKPKSTTSPRLKLAPETRARVKNMTKEYGFKDMDALITKALDLVKDSKDKP